jgi:hypothetical protein
MYNHNGLKICSMAVQLRELSFEDIMIMPFDSRAQSICSTVLMSLIIVRHCKNPASPRKVPQFVDIDPSSDGIDYNGLVNTDFHCH